MVEEKGRLIEIPYVTEFMVGGVGFEPTTSTV